MSTCATNDGTGGSDAAGPALDDLGLPARIVRTLSRQRVGAPEPAETSAEDLLVSGGIGEGNVWEIGAAPARHGLALAPARPAPTGGSR